MPKGVRNPDGPKVKRPKTTDPRNYAPEPAADTVAVYIAQTMRVQLDPKLPSVKLESTLGAECKKAIDGAYALQRAHGLFLDSNSEALRTILRTVIEAAIGNRDAGPLGPLAEPWADVAPE